jgi:NAD(P)-dependent dehydrogenase (short-subunit alcohol dehydrogenase family)
MNGASGLLAGRRALVLGLDDIGNGIARRFEREGARVATLRGTTPTTGRASGDEIAQAVQALDGLDLLVCNLLSAPGPCPLDQLDDLRLHDALQAVSNTVVAMRAALPALRESGRGRIVLVGHRYGETVGESIAAYNAAAWALVGLARTAALEWGQYQVATNVLLPLARTAEFDAARARRPAVIDKLVSQLPLRRVGDPVEDVGGAAVFLASDAARFVNGQVICADGGQQVAGPVLNPARFA